MTLAVITTVSGSFLRPTTQTMDNSGVASVIGWPRAADHRTPVDLSRSDFFDSSSVYPSGHKRSMSWLLAAVMSVCEEDPRNCRVAGRGRQQFGAGGGGGEYIIVDTGAGKVTVPIQENGELPKRSADDGRDTASVFSDRQTVNGKSLAK